MKKKRPNSILIIAILHLVGGGLGLIFALCGGIGLAMQSSLTTATPSNKPEDMGVRIQVQVAQKLPSSKPMQIEEYAVSFMLSVMMLAAGIGLLSMSNWARILSLVYAGISIIQHLVSMVYFVFVLWPVMGPIIDAELKSLPGGAGGAAAGISGFVKISAIGGVIFQGLLMIYPIVVLIMMLMPSVGAAFAAKPRQSRRGEEDDDDYDEDEDDRPRRRSARRDEDDEDDEDDDRRGNRGGGRYRS